MKILGFFGNRIVNFSSIEKKVEGMTDHIIRYKKTPLRIISKLKPAGFLFSDLFLMIMEQCAMTRMARDSSNFQLDPSLPMHIHQFCLYFLPLFTIIYCHIGVFYQYPIVPKIQTKCVVIKQDTYALLSLIIFQILT